MGEVIEKRENRKKIYESIKKIREWKVKKYEEKYEVLKKNLKTMDEEIDELELKNNQITEIFPMYQITQMNTLILKRMANKMREEEKYQDKKWLEKLKDVIYNKDRGIITLMGTRRENIREQLCSQIYSLVNGPDIFIDSFLNVLITGSSGIGKTKLAQTISFIYHTCGILYTDNVIVDRKSTRLNSSH